MALIVSVSEFSFLLFFISVHLYSWPSSILMFTLLLHWLFMHLKPYLVP